MFIFYRLLSIELAGIDETFICDVNHFTGDSIYKVKFVFL